MSQSNVFLLVCAVLAAGCSNSPNEATPPQGQPSPATPANAEQPQGYNRAFVRSSFDLGPSIKTNELGPLLREEGTFGVFAVNRANGAVYASSSVRSPLAHVKFKADGKSHNEMARNYFSKAGIPLNEIEGVQANALMSGHNEPGSERDIVETEGFISSLFRAVDGVRVVDSVAWVRLSDSGQPSAETIYWPAVPREAVAATRRFQARFSNGQESLETLVKSLGGERGEIVLRHTAHTVAERPEFFVSLDVTSHRESMTVTRHFDPEGREFQLPQERVTAQTVGPAK